MTTNKMFIPLLEQTLKNFQQLEEDSNLPKKFSMKAITTEMSAIMKTFKDEKDVKKKGSGKKSAYNLFVKEQMEVVKTELPDLTNSERMTEIGRRWQQFKEDNPNYNELYEDKLNEENRKIDYVKSDSEEEVDTKKKTKKSAKKKSDSDDEVDTKKKTKKSAKKKSDSDDEE
jgi:hypothetical protein